MDTILAHSKRLIAEGDRYLAFAVGAIKRRSPVGLFGAGDLGRRMRTMLEACGIAVVFFTDNDKNKWGKEIDGLPVLPLEEAAREQGVFLIACSSDALKMREQLRGLGVRECDTALYLSCQVLFHSRDSFLSHEKELARLYPLLSDEASHTTLAHLVLHAYTLDGAHIHAIETGAQYFFSDAFAVREGERVIDAGAYTGDTIRDMVSRFGPVFKEVHCFEPDRDNFRRLEEYVARAGLGEKVITHRLGLSDKKKTLCFSGSGLGFHIEDAPDAESERVDADTIDNLFGRSSSERVDFIKMDIEGAEPLALRGGAKVIARDRPRLAICVYHAPEHLWTIPFYIKKLVPEYRLFLRHHSASAHETVVYAVV